MHLKNVSTKQLPVFFIKNSFISNQKDFNKKPITARDASVINSQFNLYFPLFQNFIKHETKENESQIGFKELHTKRLKDLKH